MHSSPKKLFLIIWWSRTGASDALSEACYLAARAADCTGVESVRVRADSVQLADLLRAHALVFVCPENLGSMAGMMKEFFDLHYYDALGRLEGIPYQIMVSAGSDGSGAVRQIERIATGWRLRKVADALIVNLHAQEPEAIARRKVLDEDQLARAREIGISFANALELGIY